MKKRTVKKKSVALLIRAMKKTGNERKEKIWKDLAARLNKPRRILPSVNIAKIDFAAGKNKGKVLVVPGKVLGKGELYNKAEVAAFEFSESALAKIKGNGNALSLRELLDSKKKASEMVIVK